VLLVVCRAVVQRYVTINMVSMKGTYEELFMYAARVAAGYRPPINPKLPQQVISLIKASPAPERPLLCCVSVQTHSTHTKLMVSHCSVVCRGTPPGCCTGVKVIAAQHPACRSCAVK
jgi:hypothetical protein